MCGENSLQSLAQRKLYRSFTESTFSLRIKGHRPMAKFQITRLEDRIVPSALSLICDCGSHKGGSSKKGSHKSHKSNKSCKNGSSKKHGSSKKACGTSKKKAGSSKKCKSVKVKSVKAKCK